MLIPSESENHSVVSLCDPMDCTVQNTGVGSHSLFQGIFSSQDQTQVSHIAGGFFTSWVSREAQTPNISLHPTLPPNNNKFIL